MSQFVTLNRIMKDDYHYNEAIKTLRTNIQFCGNGIKTIMLTSSLPDEGKSDITFAMASSLAQIGKRVVMIESQHHICRTLFAESGRAFGGKPFQRHDFKIKGKV